MTNVGDLLGHILTIVSIVISCIAVHRSRKKDFLEAADRVQLRHDENAASMTRLAANVENVEAKVEHLDNCMDKLRSQVQSAMRRLSRENGSKRR